MKLFDLAYSMAMGNHGILTASAARTNGIASKDLARWVKIGRFVKCGNAVYKATQYPSSEDDIYAIAVARCGNVAYLCGESVIGLLRLMPVAKDCIYVRAPRYLRRKLPECCIVSVGKPEYVPIKINGILCQKPADAIRECIHVHTHEELFHAAQTAHAAGHIDAAEFENLKEAILGETRPRSPHTLRPMYSSSTSQSSTTVAK